jgi:hypothetical protein
LAKATTDGVVRAPSEFSSTVDSPPSMTAMQELVVPRSIPRILDIELVSFLMSPLVASVLSFFSQKTCQMRHPQAEAFYHQGFPDRTKA